MLAAGLGLHECLLKNLERQTVALDVHLRCRQAVTCTGRLEVHVAQVILIAEDVAQYGILVLARVLDQTHGDT